MPDIISFSLTNNTLNVGRLLFSLLIAGVSFSTYASDDFSALLANKGFISFLKANKLEKNDALLFSEEHQNKLILSFQETNRSNLGNEHMPSSSLINVTEEGSQLNPIFFEHWRDTLQFAQLSYLIPHYDIYGKRLYDGRYAQSGNIKIPAIEHLKMNIDQLVNGFEKKGWKLSPFWGNSGITNNNPHGFIDIPGIVASKITNGKQTIEIAFHGSIGLDDSIAGPDWDTNFDFKKTKIETLPGLYHGGFLKKYQALKPQLCKILNELIETEVPVANIIVTGHSHGGGIAQIAIADLCHNWYLEKFKDFNNVRDSIFHGIFLSSPRSIGNDATANDLHQFIGKNNLVYISSENDIVTKTPINFSDNFGYQAHIDLKQLNSNAFALNNNNDDDEIRLKLLKKKNFNKKNNRMYNNNLIKIYTETLENKKLKLNEFLQTKPSNLFIYPEKEKEKAWENKTFFEKTTQTLGRIVYFGGKIIGSKKIDDIKKSLVDFLFKNHLGRSDVGFFGLQMKRNDCSFDPALYSKCDIVIENPSAFNKAPINKAPIRYLLSCAWLSFLIR